MSISRIDVSDTSPALDQIVKVKIHVRNTGISTITNAFVGLSLLQSNSVCNRDCYTDGKGDYAQTGILFSGDEVVVERDFKIRSDKFTNDVATFTVSASTEPYVPAFMFIASSGTQITILLPSQKLNACPIHLKASNQQARVGDMVTYTATIENRGMPYTFYIGMSIGRWDGTSQDTEYTSPQPATLKPCNIDCYRDKLGNFVAKTLSSNYTDFVTRTFEIPDYFPQQPFDVVVGVWGSVKTDENTKETVGDVPVCFVYFKNVTTVIEGESATREFGNFLSGVMTGGATIVARATGTSIEAGGIILWVLVSAVLTLIAMYLTKSPIIGVAIFLTMFIAGTFVNLIPGWVAIIIIVLVGLLAAKFMTGGV
jgi:hypothetical protein